MELYSLQVFLTVATEKSFSRAAEKLLRTQPAISLALQRLEQELGEKLIDRSGKELLLTDAGRIVLDYARRFENLHQELDNSLAELRDNSAGPPDHRRQRIHLALPAAPHRALPASCIPKVKVQVRRSLSSKIPDELIDGNLELGVISYDPEDERLNSMVIYTDHLAFVVSPAAPPRQPQDRCRSRELGMENFIAHNVVSPYRDVVLREFQRHKVPLHMDVEMPTVETIRKLVQSNEGVAFLPRMCVEQEIEQKTAVRSAREGDARGAQDPPGLSHAARAQPRGEGVPRSAGMSGPLPDGRGSVQGSGPPTVLLHRQRHVGLRIHAAHSDLNRHRGTRSHICR